MNTTDNIVDIGSVSPTESTVITRDKTTGLLRIECKHAATSAEEMTPERIAELLLEQEVSWLTQFKVET